MSYVVLARKYRPRSFSEMVGQEHVVRALGNALDQQRLHHAYLFTGTRGVGKTTVSRILAKSLNCLGADGNGGITSTPCGVCQACTDIDAGRFVDYTELDAASNRGVDEVQSLLEQAVYKPVQGRFKVFMIDEVHMLTGHAFNAMLKTLEEPPEYLKFVLATTDPQKVPVTVLSRCLQFNLRPMAPETITEHLERVLAAESVPADAGALRLISRAARGSMRDALSLADQAIAFGAGQLRDEAVRQMLGSVDRSHVLRLIAALAEGDGASIIDTTETLRVHGLSAAATLEEMCAVLHRMAIEQAVPSADTPADPEAAEICRLAQALPADQTQLLYSLCLHGRADLGLAPDEYAALTMVLLRLLAFRPSAEKKTLSEPGAARPAARAPQPAAAPAAPAAATRPGAVSRPVPPDARPSVPQAAAPLASAPDTITADSEPSRLPPGQRLAVLDPTPARAQAGALRDPPAAASFASRVLGVPVRVAAESAADAPPAAVESVETTPEGDFWHALVRQLVERESITALARELALQSQLVGRDEGHWLLRVERESLDQPASRERLRLALEVHGHSVSLSVEVGQVRDSPARRNAAAAARLQREAESAIMGDPFVQSMMRDFGAKIVPGSIKPVKNN